MAQPAPRCAYDLFAVWPSMAAPERGAACVLCGMVKGNKKPAALAGSGWRLTGR